MFFQKVLKNNIFEIQLQKKINDFRCQKKHNFLHLKLYVFVSFEGVFVEFKNVEFHDGKIWFQIK